MAPVMGVEEPVPTPLSDVALPPAGIRFIWLGTADVAGGAGVFALGGAVEEAGCARTGVRIARAATAATPIKTCFISSLPMGLTLNTRAAY
jgi:hypothetical protein